MLSSFITSLMIIGMALVYLLVFSFFSHYLDRFVENSILRRSSIHGYSSLASNIFHGLKRMILKEELIPTRGHVLLFVILPIIFFSLSLSLWCNAVLIPHLGFVPGSLFIVYGLTLLISLLLVPLGWASNSKYPILASFRVLKVLLPIELTLLFLIFSIVVHFGTYQVDKIIEIQSSGLVNWGVVKQPVAAIIFLFLVVIKSSRPPFDFVIRSNDLAGGLLSEFSAFGRNLLRGGLWVEYVFLVYLFVVAFLGAGDLGFDIKAMNNVSALLQNMYSSGIILLKFILVFIVIKVACVGFPNLNLRRLDNLVRKILLPVMVINLLVTVILSRAL